ncbi:hypothetical protein M011DRAFT_490752 [Sporormia fimetaria CBS 119925]|uniref:Uncharacterized protein n=1 Tax=Sporormia fimetaria CBS 119925 TaxID=1340428 RepID=A0A6A6UYK8_9PLEO|nr:hypothetical protein M011DRAFT_490752 [Sporormia fimetaria CBS 119925]
MNELYFIAKEPDVKFAEELLTRIFGGYFYHSELDLGKAGTATSNVTDPTIWKGVEDLTKKLKWVSANTKKLREDNQDYDAKDTADTAREPDDAIARFDEEAMYWLEDKTIEMERKADTLIDAIQSIDGLLYNREDTDSELVQAMRGSMLVSVHIARHMYKWE